VVNVDAGAAPVSPPLVTGLTDLFSQNGATAAIFRRAQIARYDDGHAFKFRAKGVREALRGVADDLLAQKPGDVLAHLESALAARLH
jgi:hypothetical protein